MDISGLATFDMAVIYVAIYSFRLPTVDGQVELAWVPWLNATPSQYSPSSAFNFVDIL